MGFVLLNPSYGLRATDFGHPDNPLRRSTAFGGRNIAEFVLHGMTDGITEWTRVSDRFEQRGSRSRL